MLDKRFQIGTFCFRLRCEDGLVIPRNFMIFETEKEAEYLYEIRLTDFLPDPEGILLTERCDLKVYQTDAGEERFIGIKGMEAFYGCYREMPENKAEIWLDRNRIQGLHIDPVFVSLLALERHLIRDNQVVLHCAYTEYMGEAILFSAPSETGKTTQATLWETYRGSRTINGDRALLCKRGEQWSAEGWPVCGTSGVCFNETFPIKAIVMLSQSKENQVKKIGGKEAFSQVYSQMTVNRWNRVDSIQTMELLMDILERVPVYHLQCDISEGAVECLEKVLI